MGKTPSHFNARVFFFEEGRGLRSEEFDKVFCQVCDEWNKAELSIKLAENVNGEIVNPAVFELRYAGRRIVEAFQKFNTEPQSAISLLRDAKFDCHRSQHDAVDAATSKMAGDLTVAVEFLSASIVMKNFPDFTELYGKLSSVRQKIAKSREDRENRDKIYNSIQNSDLPRMVELFQNFKASESLMLEAAEQERKERNRNNLFGWFGIAVGIIGVIVALIGIAIAL